MLLGRGQWFQRRVKVGQGQRRGWSGGQRVWSVRGRSVLVLLTAVTCQSLTVVSGGSLGGHRSTSVMQLSTCRVLVNNTIIDLGRLRDAQHDNATHPHRYRTPAHTLTKSE